MEPFTRLQKVKIAAIMVAAILLIVMLFLGWSEPARPDANWVQQGNAELLEPAGFYQPWTTLQVGRNAFENLIHGTNYAVPIFYGYEDVFNAMVEFHAQRYAWFILYNGGPLISHETAVAVIVIALRYDKDYRISIATLLFESTFGLGSSNLYGFACGNSGSWVKQTDDYFRTIAGYGYGNDPSAIYGYYNCWKPVYINNCLAIYRSCDGGDQQ